jgi:hypothetical protein
LKEENKKDRLRWCVTMLDPSTLPNNPKFRIMKNIIPADEKWFNGTRKTKTMYMHPDEEDPHRTVQNKNVIHKIMIYSSVTQPRFDVEGRCYFDGKLGVQPFVHELAIFVMLYSYFAIKELVFILFLFIILGTSTKKKW